MLRQQIGDWVLMLKLFRVQWTHGLTSLLPDGSHFLMWETDDKDPSIFIEDLEALQTLAKLPSIYIFKSSPTKGYHALCFKKVTFRQAILCAASIRAVDLDWVGWAFKRKALTLRTGPKQGCEPEPYLELPSPTPDDFQIDELQNWVRYQIHAKPTA